MCVYEKPIVTAHTHVISSPGYTLKWGGGNIYFISSLSIINVSRATGGDSGDRVRNASEQNGWWKKKNKKLNNIIYHNTYITVTIYTYYQHNTIIIRV